MENYKPKHGSMGNWLIVVAIDGNVDLIDKMKVNEDGSYPVKFEVGGVELDFSKVAERIEKWTDVKGEDRDAIIKNAACELLIEKYNSLIEEIEEIKTRIEDQKDTLFKYEWEK